MTSSALTSGLKTAFHVSRLKQSWPRWYLEKTGSDLSRVVNSNSVIANKDSHLASHNTIAGSAASLRYADAG